MGIAVDIVTTVCIGWLIGTEFAVSAFVNPILYQLDDRARTDAIRRFAKKLGAVMPFWYIASLVLLLIEIVARWNEPGRAWILAANAIWAAVIVLTLLYLVPINNRIAGSEAGLSAEMFRHQHHKWDVRHRWRVAALGVAMVCLLIAIRIGG
ncbi:MAG TPA: DUF1772 domain-containing protein [Terracidiphilus sp.]|nr:DUF1772 domain-containing protein [Terracidiphilus sp.]